MSASVCSLLEAVTKDELTNDEEYTEIVEDMRDECGKYGQVQCWGNNKEFETLSLKLASVFLEDGRDKRRICGQLRTVFGSRFAEILLLLLLLLPLLSYSKPARCPCICIMRYTIQGRI